ncbi:RNA polymerase sigma factor RpoD/SigA [Candidatus Falkowbacteria bacterium]|nr:RNA polymerase sigma factor RpoD/SigA [Candidatus Falkowbacteria bacterium]
MNGLAGTAGNDKNLQRYFKEIGEEEPLTSKQERELSEKIQQGDIKARDTLARANLRFVVSVAKGYQGKGLSFADLIAEGNRGLLAATQRFDGERGLRFISYAVWWVRQAILEALAEQGRVVRMPMNLVAIVNKIRKAGERLAQELGHEPEIEEIAEELALLPDVVERTLSRARNTRSLDASFKKEDEGAANLYDVTPDGNPPPDEELVDGSQKEAIIQVLADLDPKEREVIYYYFGLKGYPRLTLEEIGEQLELTRERIRQIKEQAIRRLQYPSRRARLEPYYQDL